MSEDTERVNTTLNRKTVEWLRDRYPDATSDGERLRAAVKDARDLDRLMEQKSVTFVPEQS